MLSLSKHKGRFFSTLLDFFSWGIWPISLPRSNARLLVLGSDFRRNCNHSVKGGKDLLFQVQCFEFDLLPSSGSGSVSESASKPDPDTDPDPEYSVNPSLMGYAKLTFFLASSLNFTL